MDDALAGTGLKNASLDRTHEAGVWRLLSPGRLFVLAFALRCAFALWLPAAIVWPDGERYVLIAENLLAGAGFGSLEMNKIAVPTQPLLIAALLGISGHSYVAARVGFALIGALSCVLTYRLATAVFDRRVGSLAALLLAIYPLHAYSSALFEIPQGIFILLMSAALLALNTFASKRETGMLLAAGIACGGAALSVPTVLPYLAALPAWFILVDARVGFWLRNTAVFLCGVVLVLAPWVGRNYAAYDRFVLINAAGGENFWKANSSAWRTLRSTRRGAAV
ncbi:MAG: glycosyltransferase family 39 protein [Methylotetracoccus sp.]